MFPTYHDCLVRQELQQQHHEELLREGEQRRLIRTADLPRSEWWNAYWRISHSMGIQMMRVGMRIQTRADRQFGSRIR